MLAHARDMQGYAGALQELGADIASEQAAPFMPGRRYRYDVLGLQARWNQAMEAWVRAYQSMAGTHEANTMVMMAHDHAEAAKGWQRGGPALDGAAGCRIPR